MSRGRALVAAAMITLAPAAGCTGSAFTKPVTVSTKSDAVAITKKLGPVRVSTCTRMILFVPYEVEDGPAAFDELLAQSKKLGGNAVVDVQWRAEDFTMVFPFYMGGCGATTGTAAIVEGRSEEAGPAAAPAASGGG